MNRFIALLSITFVFVVCFSSCGNKATENTPDVSKINITYHSFPFYKDFSKLDAQNVAAGLETLNKKYPYFTNFFLDTLVGFGYHGQYNDTNRLMDTFLLQKDYRSLLDTVVSAFPNTEKYDNWLKKSFQYLRYYDSTFEIPENVYYFVSGLNGYTTVLQNDKNMGIGLDMFLGRDFLPYAQLNFSDYATIRMTDDNIPVWTMENIYLDKYPFISDDKDLLALMIQKGKEMYFLEKTVPYVKDEVRFGYTKEQMDWCMKNEALIYNFMVQGKLLFDKNLQKTLRYVNPGPTSAGMPMESPGSIGNFIGWRIVKKYLEHNPTSMHELLEIKDPQVILEGAKYKP